MQDEAVRIGACKEIWKAEGEMKKYAIKNCSASVEYSNGAGKFIYCSCKDKLCENINDCMIKQIVELCGKEKHTGTNPYADGNYNMAQKILNLLEIEEFDEE